MGLGQGLSSSMRMARFSPPLFLLQKSKIAEADFSNLVDSLSARLFWSGNNGYTL
jgi:hypothetical protein